MKKNRLFFVALLRSSGATLWPQINCDVGKCCIDSGVDIGTIEKSI